MADNVPRGVDHWGVIGDLAASSGSLAGAALSLGGNVRVGLEDNFYLPDGDDGALQRRPHGAGAADGRGRRAASGDGGGGAGAPGSLRRARRARRHPRVLDLSRLLPGGFCSGCWPTSAPTCSRSRTRARRLRALGAAALRGRGPERGLGAVPGAQPQQALDPDRPQVRGGARGAAAARARVRRAARGLPPRRDGAARRRLRAPEAGEPAARLLRDHRLRAGRPVPRPLGPRHELPRARRAARADRRGRRAARAGGRPDRRPRRRAR